MSITESEMALDTIVQQTWKRARTSREIDAFLARREGVLQACSASGGNGFELDF